VRVCEFSCQGNLDVLVPLCAYGKQSWGYFCWFCIFSFCDYFLSHYLFPKFDSSCFVLLRDLVTFNLHHAWFELGLLK